jgi:predicted nucleic acid-binding protein
MRSLACIDASLSLKIVLNEEDSHIARKLWDQWHSQGTVLIAPTLWAYEVVSVIRNRVHRKLIPEETEEELVGAILALPVDLLWPSRLHKRAWELARYFHRPAAYDMHYIALAEMNDCPFWTADNRLYQAVRADLKWVVLAGIVE